MHTAIQTPPAEMAAGSGAGCADVAGVLSGVLDSLNSQDLWRAGDSELLAGTRDLLLCLERLRAQAPRRVAEIESRGATTTRHGVRTSEWLHATNWSTLGDARRQVRAAVELAARPDAIAAKPGQHFCRWCLDCCVHNPTLDTPTDKTDPSKPSVENNLNKFLPVEKSSSVPRNPARSRPRTIRLIGR